MLENEKINCSENFQLQERSGESESCLAVSYSLWPHRWYWNAKVGSQELPGVTGKFGIGVQNEAGQKLTKYCQENALVIANTLFQQHKRRTHGHHQMVNTEIRLIIFFAAKDGEALYSQWKQDRGADCCSAHELLIAKFRFKMKKERKPLDHSGMT